MHLSPPPPSVGLGCCLFLGSRSVVDDLLLYVPPNFCGGSLLWYALLYVLSSFTILLTRKRELVALLLLSYGSLYSKPAVALPHGAMSWSAVFFIVVFPDHTHLRLGFMSSHWLFNQYSPYNVIFHVI